MERIIRNDDEFRRFYNCSFYNVSHIPLELRQNIPLGIFYVVVSILELMLYLFCLVPIWRRRHESCYKLMFVMGILDIGDLCLFGLKDGWLEMTGDVFCSHPTLRYPVDCLALALWLSETLVEVSLALNRCLYFAAPKVCETLFGSSEPQRRKTAWRTWLWMIPPGFFGGYYFLFGAPFHYSPLAHIPLAEPHYGFTEDMYPIYSEYNNHKLWIIYNCMYSIVLPSTYGIFIVAVLLQMRSLGWTAAAAAGSIFAQVAIIAAINSMTALMSSLLNFFPRFAVNHTLVLHVILEFLFMQSGGIPPIIYLTLNQGIRIECRQMVLNLFGVKLYRLSHSTRAELKRVSHMVHHQQEGESSPNGMAHTPQIEINNPHEAIEMAEIE